MDNEIVYLQAPGHFVQKCIKMPEHPAPNFVRLKHYFCGICGGDYSAFLGRRNDFPVSLGHESVSSVVDMGSGVQQFGPGDIVVTDFNFRCGKCIYCQSNKSHLCDQNDVGLFSNRAFARYSDVHASYLIKINLKEDRLITGTLIEPLSCVIHALQQAGTTQDSSVLILGCGNIGTLAAFYLQSICHLQNVFLSDIVESKVKRITDLLGSKPYRGEGVDLIFEATNAVSGLLSAINLSKKGQRLCSISHLYGMDTRLIYENLVKKEISVIFPLRNGEKNNMLKACHYITQKWETEYDLLIDTFPLDMIQGVFENKTEYPKNKLVISINAQVTA